MTEFSYTVKDPSGIHARPAGMLVKEASKYNSSIKIECRGKTADAKRIFSIMSMGVKCGETINFSIEGNDESSAKEGLTVFLRENL